MWCFHNQAVDFHVIWCFTFGLQAIDFLLALPLQSLHQLAVPDLEFELLLK